MPAKKKSKVYPVIPLDPVEAQVRRAAEFYTTGKGKVRVRPALADVQDVMAEMMPKMIEAQLETIDRYKRGELSPSIQKKYVTLWKKIVTRFPTE